MAVRKFFSFLNLAVGVGSTFAVNFLSVGDFENALFLYLCPFTVIVWVPVSFLLGFMVMTLVDAFFGRKTRKASEIPELTKEGFLKGVASVQSVSSRSAALKFYLQQATAKEVDRGVMLALLIKNGWSETEIDAALAEISAVGEA